MASLLFKNRFITRMHDIDAAGVVFFARIFYYAHDAYETFLNSHEQSINHILSSECILPVSHVEADFIAPMYLNEQIDIEIYTQDVKESEFSLSYHFVDDSGNIRATALTRHVCLKSQTRIRQTLSNSILHILK